MIKEPTSHKIFIEDITNGLENNRISFVNDINYQQIPKSVLYITKNVLSSYSLVEDFESMPVPCKCEVCCDGCSCALGASIAYKNEILSEDFIMNFSRPILECSNLCKCTKSCSNRVVQNGIKVSLQVFATEHKGFGVRTLESIPKFVFVCEYSGEIIDKFEAEKRLKNRPITNPNYVFILKEHSDNDSYISTIIDPTSMGNVGRYLNHSCSPNLIPISVRVDNMLPRICFFSLKDIMPFEELTYNYGSDACQDIVKIKSDSSIIRTFKQCYCKSSDCTGALPFDANCLFK